MPPASTLTTAGSPQVSSCSPIPALRSAAETCTDSSTAADPAIQLWPARMPARIAPVLSSAASTTVCGMPIWPSRWVSWLPRVDAERQPVSGLGGDLLSQDHQQVVTGEPSPGTVHVGCVVLGGGDEVQPARTGTGRKLRRRQFAAVRAHRMHMAVTSVPAAPPASRPPRREARLPDPLRHLIIRRHPESVILNR